MPHYIMVRAYACQRYGMRQQVTPAGRYNSWYQTPEWQALRDYQLNREPYCRMCRRAGHLMRANTADHIIPHRGDRRLFLDAANLQSLCQIHHGEKQRIEYGGKEKVPVSSDGWPLA